MSVVPAPVHFDKGPLSTLMPCPLLGPGPTLTDHVEGRGVRDLGWSEVYPGGGQADTGQVAEPMAQAVPQEVAV